MESGKSFATQPVKDEKFIKATLLNDCIASIGWRREDIYITNIVKRRPPENRDPLPAEIGAYQPYLTRQIEIINPKDMSFYVSYH